LKIENSTKTKHFIYSELQTINISFNETDNTMVKRKSTEGQTTIYKTPHRKLKIELHEPD